MTGGAGFDDEMLMAYADGELSESERGAITRAAASDPAIAARIADFSASRAAAKAAFADLRAQEPPARLVAAALGGSLGGSPEASGARLPQAPAERGERIVRLAPRRPLARTRFALPLAAAIAVAAGVAGYLAGRAAQDPAAGGLASVDAAFSALASLPSGAEVAVTIDGAAARATALASFRTADGACRIALIAFAAGEAMRAVGCASEPAGGDASWRARLVVAEGASGAFGPASAAGVEIVEATLDALDAGDAMTPEQEAAAIAAAWR